MGEWVYGLTPVKSSRSGQSIGDRLSQRDAGRLKPLKGRAPIPWGALAVPSAALAPRTDHAKDQGGRDNADDIVDGQLS